MTQQKQQRDYHFDTTISREVLCNYLSRAISMQGLCESPQLDDDLRMLDNIGAKFIGRAAYTWSQHPPEQNEAHFAAAERAVSEYHQRYDDITVFQAAIFEAVYENYVSTVVVPPWVFEAFDQPVEQRCFNYEAMLYDRGRDYGEPVKWRPHAGNDWMRGYSSTCPASVIRSIGSFLRLRVVCTTPIKPGGGLFFTYKISAHPGSANMPSGRRVGSGMG